VGHQPQRLREVFVGFLTPPLPQAGEAPLGVCPRERRIKSDGLVVVRYRGLQLLLILMCVAAVVVSNIEARVESNGSVEVGYRPVYIFLMDSGNAAVVVSLVESRV